MAEPRDAVPHVVGDGASRRLPALGTDDDLRRLGRLAELRHEQLELQRQRHGFGKLERLGIEQLL
jgi:hypothetical protein